jgi:outer membrane protein
LGLTAISVIPAIAQEAKIGYVDSQKIFAQSPEFQEAQARFDKEVTDWNDQAATMNEQVEKLKEESQKNSLVWSASKKQEADATLKAKQDSLQQYLDDTFGPSGKAEKRMAELSKPIKDRIIGIIKRIAIENDFDMVLDAANVSIAYAKESLDLTDQVIAELAKEK